ncbi:MAG: DUF4933 domain-containing protein [Bacteroidales bacterium]|jgi:hypothetical protein|nr:DUF4933 domain-containing protein [Bacteroidales bacterium]
MKDHPVNRGGLFQILTRYVSLTVLSLITCHLSLFSCSSRNPNLSEKQLLELANDTMPTVSEKEDLRADTGKYIPSGVQYREKRGIDPARPPVTIDVIRNRNNRSRLKLSDIASSLRTIRIKYPEGNSVRLQLHITGNRIYASSMNGLYDYSENGGLPVTIVKNETDKGTWGIGFFGTFDVWKNLMMYNYFERENDELKVNELLICAAEGHHKNNVIPLSKTIRAKFINDHSIIDARSFTGLSLRGDTLCRFTDYEAGNGITNPESSALYRINGELTLRKAYNDTVFRVTAPNRWVPAYVVSFGEYRATSEESRKGSDMAGKLIPRSWYETPAHIYMTYCEGRDYPNRRNREKVPFWGCIYNKATRMLVHQEHNEHTYVPLSFENDLDPDGIPFWIQGVTEDGELYMTVTKEDIRERIASGQYPETAQKLYDSMPENEQLIVIAK